MQGSEGLNLELDKHSSLLADRSTRLCVHMFKTLNPPTRLSPCRARVRSRSSRIHRGPHQQPHPRARCQGPLGTVRAPNHGIKHPPRGRSELVRGRRRRWKIEACQGRKQGQQHAGGRGHRQAWDGQLEFSSCGPSATHATATPGGRWRG